LGPDASLPLDAGAARDWLIEAAREAGEIALAYYRRDAPTTARVEAKAGGSPVTQADLEVDAFLRERLGARFPAAGWLSEETEDDLRRLACASLLVVDPIDGTRGFLAGDPRWAVSIALVAGGRPIAGVVHAPALGETYAAAQGGGATLNGAPIGVSGRPALREARIAGPKPLVDALGRAAGVGLVAGPKIPSLAYRMALVARGELELGLAAEKSHDWDVAAVDLVLAEAGGRLVEAAGAPLRYNRAETRRGVLFGGAADLIDQLVAAGRLAACAPRA
jgi:myo-inositol-1(or 4)-monophosphatase